MTQLSIWLRSCGSPDQYPVSVVGEAGLRAARRFGSFRQYLFSLWACINLFRVNGCVVMGSLPVSSNAPGHLFSVRVSVSVPPQNATIALQCSGCTASTLESLSVTMHGTLSSTTYCSSFLLCRRETPSSFLCMAHGRYSCL